MTVASQPRHPISAAASFLALALGALAAGGCGEKAPSGPSQRPPTPVVVKQARRADVPMLLAAVGTVQARASIGVKSRVGGEIRAVELTEGQDVKRGDVLFRIDPRPFEAALAQSAANLARDQALAENAASDAHRYADLVEKDYVTKEQYDGVIAKAASSEAAVRADQAALENARVDLGYCTIRSPIDGRAGAVFLHAGNVVKADDAQPLVVLHQVRPIDVAFSVTDVSLPEIRARMAESKLAVSALPRGATGPAAEGELTFVDNEIDRATGTILLKATFPNEDSALWPGQYVEVSLRLSTLSQAVVVPSEAIQAGQQGQYLYVVKPDATAELRPVKVTATVGGESVIAEGVEAGETVVTDGQVNLAPGSKVEVKGDPEAKPTMSDAKPPAQATPQPTNASVGGAAK